MDVKTPNWFSQRQRSVVAAGATVFCATLTFLFACGILWAVGSVLAYLSDVLVPLAVAAVLAVFFKPYYSLIYNATLRIFDALFGKGKLKTHALALPLFYISLLLPIALICIFFGRLLMEQTVALIQALPSIAERAGHAMTEGSPRISEFVEKYNLAAAFPALNDPGAAISSWLEGISLGGLGGKAVAVGARAAGWAVSLFGWLIVPVYLAYFLTRPTFGTDEVAAVVKDKFVFLKRSTRDDLGDLVKMFLETVVSYFRGQLLDVCIQGILLGFGFWLVGLPWGFLVGLLIGFMNLVPYLGNVVGLCVAIPLALFGDGGGFARLLWTLGVFGLVQILDGFFISVRIQGGRTGLSDFEIVFSILFWGVVFNGLIGVLLAVPLTAFVKVLWALLCRKYLQSIKNVA